MLHAHLVNIASPGSYNSQINKLLKQNNLPQVKLPDNLPSADILTQCRNQENKQGEKEEMDLESGNTREQRDLKQHKPAR